MGYVIAAIVVLLLVAGFITFMVLNATRRRETSAAGIAAPDESPLGSTAEHSGMDPATEGSEADPGSERSEGEPATGRRR